MSARLKRKIALSLLIAMASLFLLELVARIALSGRQTSLGALEVAGGVVRTEWLPTLVEDLGDTNFAVQLYEADPRFFWTLRPGLKASLENLVYGTRGEPIRWHLSTNRDGHRGPVWPERPQESDPLVACFGDSVTFGFRVSNGETYPAQLQKALRQHGLENAQVINHGIPGYSSFQGSRLMESVLGEHSPDVVVISYGANDLEVDLTSDREKGIHGEHLVTRIKLLLSKLALVQWLGPDRQKRSTDNSTEPWPRRVSFAETEENLKNMVRMARNKGARVILLNSVFVVPAYRELLERIAREEGATFVDGPELMRAALADIERGTRFEKDRNRLDDFWDTELEQYRQVYYDPIFYQNLFNDPVWRGLLRYLMVEPVHPGPLGHRILADRLAEMILREP